MFIDILDLGEKVVCWRINRPERANGLGPTILRDLRSLIQAVREDANAPRAIVLSAVSRDSKDKGRTWIGGGDLTELAGLTSTDAGREYAELATEVCSDLATITIPVIAAIDGTAIGGGAELALACDIRLGTAHAAFEFRQLRIGLSTGFGGSRRLVDLVGQAFAQKMIWLGQKLDAKTAVNLGLLHEVLEDSTALLVRATGLAIELASLEPRAIAIQKQLLSSAVRSPTPEILNSELLAFASLWQNPTHHSTLKNFSR